MSMSETPAKRGVGRPATGLVNPVVVASRITPELYEAVSRESARRGIKPAVAIREAIQTVFSPLMNSAA